jgi:hypothetical protein
MGPAANNSSVVRESIFFLLMASEQQLQCDSHPGMRCQLEEGN